MSDKGKIIPFNQPSDDDFKRSQSLLKKAKTAKAQEKRYDLLDQAIRLNPSNYEALLLRYDNNFDLLNSPAVEVLEQDTQEWKRNGQSSWLDLEARPFLSFKNVMAENYLAAGKLFEAKEHFQDILDADENDPLGARYKLLSIYSLTYQWSEAKALADKYYAETYADDQLIVPLMVTALLCGEEAAAKDLFADLQIMNEDLWIFLEEEPVEIILNNASITSYRTNTLESLAVAFVDILPLVMHSEYIFEWMRDMNGQDSDRGSDFDLSMPDGEENFDIRKLVSAITGTDSDEVFDKFGGPLAELRFFFSIEGLPWQGEKALRRAGLTSKEAIEKKGLKKLKKMRGIGPATIKALRENGINI